MRIRRSRPTERSLRPPADNAVADRPTPKFVGFADDQPDLYEFHTSDGQYVYVHEMECVDIDFQPLSRRLVLMFECIDSELMPQLTLSLTFEGTEIYQWVDDVSDDDVLAGARGGRVRGQVSDLGQLDRVSFSLQLLDVGLCFRATSVTCEVDPGLRERGPALR